MSGILSWYELRLDKNSIKCEVLSEQNPNFLVWHSKAKVWSQLFYLHYYSGILCSNHTRHLTGPQYLIKHSSNSFFRFIPPSGILFSLSLPHLCHQAKPPSFSKYTRNDQSNLRPFQNIRQVWTFPLPSFFSPRIWFLCLFQELTNS